MPPSTRTRCCADCSLQSAVISRRPFPGVRLRLVQAGAVRTMLVRYEASIWLLHRGDGWPREEGFSKQGTGGRPGAHVRQADIRCRRGGGFTIRRNTQDIRRTSPLPDCQSASLPALPAL